MLRFHIYVEEVSIELSSGFLFIWIVDSFVGASTSELAFGNLLLLLLLLLLLVF